jgi:hypothetical protein
VVRVMEMGAAAEDPDPVPGVVVLGRDVSESGDALGRVGCFVLLLPPNPLALLFCYTRCVTFSPSLMLCLL